MALIVQKYGGSSLANIDSIRGVAKRITQTYDAGNDVVVIVSAMTGETDRLIAMTREVCDQTCSRDYDLIVSSGEQVSLGLLSMCITSLGYSTRSYLGWQVPITTDAISAHAAITGVNPSKILSSLKKGNIVVIAGFQGIDADGAITILGRGGADTSAVAVADAVKALICEIYTDYDGLYSADPAICKEARKILRISYDEMLEFAGLGSQVLQTGSLEFAKRCNVDIHVRSSFNNNTGTLITKEDKSMGDILVTGIVYDKNEAKIAVKGVPDKPGVAARILSALSDSAISVDMIVQNVGQAGLADITFSVNKNDLEQASAITRRVASDILAKEVVSDENISKVSIVGLGMRSHTGVAAKMFSALAFNNINIQMISTSDIKISVAIEEKYTELAVRVLHEAFELAHLTAA